MTHKQRHGFLLGIACVCLMLLPTVQAAPVSVTRLDRLQRPLSVIYVGELRDGGTLTFALADQHGSGDGVLFNYKHGTVNQGRLYADGHLVPLGSAAQAQVLSAIQRYLDAQFTPAQQIDLAAGTLTAAAHAYGERGYYACRLFRAVRHLEGFPK